MDLRFDNKAVLVTGASTGIGAATAVRFAQAGARVGIHYNSSDKAAKEVLAQVRQAGSDGLPLRKDLSQPETAAALIGEFIKWAGRLDVLVNNAGGLGPRRTLDQLDLAAWRAVFALNVESVFVLTQAAAGHLKKSKGNIVNVGSIAAFNGGGPGAAHYAAAKAAVHCLTIGWARELGPDVRVNCVAPGIIDTPFHAKFSGPDMVGQRARAAIVGRAGVADEITGSILFLASSAAAYVTGETISPNGGLVLRL